MCLCLRCDLMCLACVKRAVVRAGPRVMLVPGAPPLFEAVVIFSTVSKGQHHLARGKNGNTGLTENTHIHWEINTSLPQSPAIA